MQVDPIKPKMKAPGSKRLKLQYDALLSKFGLEFSLRCYSEAAVAELEEERGRSAVVAAVAEDKVGRCRLTVSESELKATMVSALEPVIS